MKKTGYYLAIMSMIGIAGCQPQAEHQYPVTEKTAQTDDYFGTTVADPYRWLENDTSAQTAEWVKQQNEVTHNYLASIPFRDKIKERLTQIWDYPKVSAPFKKGGHYFTFKNDGLQNQSVAYIKDNLDGEDRVILDPNTLSDDGTVSLTNFNVSDNGKFLGYGISRGGSDWNEMFIKDIATGKDLTDHIQWVKFSGMSWYNDGFFYTRYPQPAEGMELSAENKNSFVCYHKIGTDQANDEVIYKDPQHPDWGFGLDITEDKKFMLLYVTESTSGNQLLYKPIDDQTTGFKPIVTNFDNDHGVVEHIDGKLLIRTNYQAPKYRLVSVDAHNPAQENWTDLIPEKEDMVLQGISILSGKIIAQYMKDAHTKVEVYNLQGEFLYELNIPILGTVSGFSGETTDTLTFYSVTSYTNPSIIYKYNVLNNTSEEYLRSQIDFDADKYETKQVFFTSKDGTKVPLFITHRKGLELDGNRPTLLYGYGGFNVSLTPGFRITSTTWLENDGVFVVANLRGGGEYGEEWHKAGTLMQKQNVFDDFIGAAEYLINNQYTSSKRLAIQGGSNGGLLIGAVANQRPDLFAVALPAVGVMDMLRYHKFTIGRYWATDYGTSEDSKEMFDYLLKYSPLHSIPAGSIYPATLVTTADHDDRVVPAHSFKFMATLQENYQGNHPVMIRIESKAGHGAGTPTSKTIEQYADLWAFAFQNMGFTPNY